MWLSGLEHLASLWEVSGLNTRLNFDFFFQIFQILSIFSHFIFFLNFPKIWANVEFIPKAGSVVQDLFKTDMLA